MKYLIDTHALLWILFEDEKLSERAKALIRSSENDIYVSIISYWEIALKYGIKKLHLENITPEEIPLRSKEIDIQTLMLSEKNVSTFYKLPKIKHQDPFDRLIIWQAITENIPLISKDKKVKEYDQFGLKIIWD